MSREERRWALHLAVPGTHDGREIVQPLPGGRVAYRQASWRQWGEPSKIGPLGGDTEAYESDRDHLIVMIGTWGADHVDREAEYTLRWLAQCGITPDRSAEWGGVALTDADDWAEAQREVPPSRGEALTTAIYLINTLLHPEGSDPADVDRAEAQAERVLDVLAALREEVAR